MRNWIVACCLLGSTAAALAEPCPGNPNALGTSRTLTVETKAFPRIGTMQYRATLPLNDHEVVLTFDDGPLAPYSNRVLDALAKECVKATYFLVGTMARAQPSVVRKIYNAGHTIGTHSQHHPFSLGDLGLARISSEVDGGIASVKKAVGDRTRGGAVFPDSGPGPFAAGGRLSRRAAPFGMERR